MADTVTEIDPERYLRNPVLDVPGAFALGIALLHSMDKTLPSPAKKAARTMRAALVELQASWAQQVEATSQPGTDPRPADQRLDRAWGAVGARLESVADLVGDLPEAKQARMLRERLFPTGLMFLTLPFEKQWAESEQRLKLSADPELAEMLASLVGDFVLDEVRDAHKDYGRVLGITAARGAAPDPARVLIPLRTALSAINSYTLQLVAAAQVEPKLLGAIRKALRPLDDLRDAQARRRGAGRGAEPTTPTTTTTTGPMASVPTTPVPDVPSDES